MPKLKIEKYLVESYTNGTSWYRVYSDGWCEQGGSIISTTGANQLLSFLKPFKDTNYTIISINQQTDDAGICVMAVRSYTGSQCYYCTGYNGNYYSEGFYWFACGYCLIPSQVITNEIIKY